MSETPTKWAGLAYVIPEANSSQAEQGLTGGYGFVACLALDLAECVSLIVKEFSEGGSQVVGFEWLNRLQDSDRIFQGDELMLIGRLESYPVQFKDVHWFKEVTQ